MSFNKKCLSIALITVLIGASFTGVKASEKDSIIGSNRYETAAKVADRMGNYNTAILVNSDNSLADGLSASSLAGKEKAPILLVKKDSIPKETIKRLNKVDKVYIVGGNAVISESVEARLLGKTVYRIEGKDRVDTSKKVANLLGGYNKAFVVNGFTGEADAMSIAPVAARDNAPILLTKGKNSNHEFKSGVKYYVVGGSRAVSNSVAGRYDAERIAGSDRYKTNRAVVNKFYSKSKKLYYTKGDILVDALTVSPLAKNNGVVLVSKKSDNSILKNKDVIQVGGMNFSVNPSKPVPDSKPSSTSDVNSREFQRRFKKKFYTLLNNHRNSNGSLAIRSDSQLEELAYLKSKHMADKQYFEHSYNGLRIFEMYPDVLENGFKMWGENIGLTWRKRNPGPEERADQFFEMWKNSPGHNANMLRPNMNAYGVSCYSDGKGNIYATLECAEF